MAENTDTARPIAVPVALFVGNDPNLAVQVAGLLTHKPELAGTDVAKTPAVWQRELDAYLKTPTS